MAAILWASADPVAEGNPGVTDRIEGVRYLLGHGHGVHLVCGAGPRHRPIPGIPSTFLPTRYVPFAGWIWLWPRLLGELRSRGAGADVIVTDFALLPPILWWRNRRRRAGREAPAIVLDLRTPPVEAGGVRTWVQRRRFAATLRLFARRAEAVTAITEGFRDEVARLARLDARTIPVWGSGCSWCDRPAQPGPRGAGGCGSRPGPASPQVGVGALQPAEARGVPLRGPPGRADRHRGAPDRPPRRAVRVLGSVGGSGGAGLGHALRLPQADRAPRAGSAGRAVGSPPARVGPPARRPRPNHPGR